MTTPTLPRITGTVTEQGWLPMLLSPNALWLLLPTLCPNVPGKSMCFTTQRRQARRFPCLRRNREPADGEQVTAS